MKNQNILGKSLVLLFIFVGGMALLAYFYSVAGGKLPTSEDPYEVQAVMTDSQQTLKHADVRSAGVTVGEVGKIENTENGKVRLTLEIQRKYAPIYRDAKVLVRQKTLVGENYIDLDPGSSKASQVPDGGSLTVAAQKEAVPIDEILNTLDPKTRRDVSNNLRAGGDSLKGRGQDLNQLFERVAPLSEDGSVLLDILNKQRAQITRLVANTGVVTGAIANRTGDLQNLVRAAKTTAEAVAARDDAVQATFESIPPTLRQARTTVANLRSFSGNATPVVDDLRTSLQSLKPVLTQLRPTAARARRLTDELPALFKATNPALTTLPRFANNTSKAVPAVEGLLRELNPALEFMTPYKREFSGFIQNWPTPYAADSLGTMARCSCPLNVNSFSNFPGETRKLLAPLLDEGVIGSVTKEEEQHFRPPGTLPTVDGSKQAYKVITRDKTPNEVVR